MCFSTGFKSCAGFVGSHRPVRRRLCDYFGVTMSELYGEQPIEQAVPEKATEEALRFALFGGTEGITDEMYDEVKRFAQFVKERERDKK